MSSVTTRETRVPAKVSPHRYTGLFPQAKPRTMEAKPTTTRIVSGRKTR